MDAATLAKWANVMLSGAFTVIFIPLAIYFHHYYWDRRRWHALERLIRTWAEQEQILPADLSDEDWDGLVATMLKQAGFEPDRMRNLAELAVSFAKGITNLEVRGRI